jgi:hypothetical protein
MRWLKRQMTSTVHAFEKGRGWRRIATVAMVVLLSLTVAGCIILRRPPENPPPGGGGGGGGGDPEPPKEVDVLVQVDLRREAGSLVSDYQRIMGYLQSGLSERNVEIRRAALAPMYRRIDGSEGNKVVPLLFGKGAGVNEFGGFGPAMSYYMTDDGAQELRSVSAVDGENLATLGMQLDQRAILPVMGADPTGEAYFRPPADGFVVVSMTASSRKCAEGSQTCQLSGGSPSEFFTQTSNGALEWLALPGEAGLKAGQVFHAAIATDEGVESYSEWESRCESEPNFPSVKLNAMEGSETAYFEPLVDRIRQRGGNGEFVRLCRAMSSTGDARIDSLADSVASMVGR